MTLKPSAEERQMEKRVCSKMILTKPEEPIDGMAIHEAQVNVIITTMWEEGWAVTSVDNTKVLMGHLFTQVDFIEKERTTETRPLEVS
jgi:hypothetical protein